MQWNDHQYVSARHALSLRAECELHALLVLAIWQLAQLIKVRSGYCVRSSRLNRTLFNSRKHTKNGDRTQYTENDIFLSGDGFTGWPRPRSLPPTSRTHIRFFQENIY